MQSLPLSCSFSFIRFSFCLDLSPRVTFSSSSSLVVYCGICVVLNTLWMWNEICLYTHCVRINNNTSHAHSSRHCLCCAVCVCVCVQYTAPKFQNWDNKCAFNFNQKQWLMQTRSGFLNKKCVTEPRSVCLCACVFLVLWHTLCNASVWFTQSGSAAAAAVVVLLFLFHFFSEKRLSSSSIIIRVSDCLHRCWWFGYVSIFCFVFGEISCSCNRRHQSNLLTTVASSSCHFSDHFIWISCWSFWFLFISVFLFVVVLLSFALLLIFTGLNFRYLHFINCGLFGLDREVTHVNLGVTSYFSFFAVEISS